MTAFKQIAVALSLVNHAAVRRLINATLALLSETTDSPNIKLLVEGNYTSRDWRMMQGLAGFKEVLTEIVEAVGMRSDGRALSACHVLAHRTHDYRTPMVRVLPVWRHNRSIQDVYPTPLSDFHDSRQPSTRGKLCL